MAVTITGSKKFGQRVLAAGNFFEKNRILNPFFKHFRLETVKLLGFNHAKLV